jgi:protein SCO1/2
MAKLRPLPRPVRLPLALLVVALAGLLAPAGAVTIGAPFALTDQFGQTRRSEEFLGQSLLLTFGYTSCPDICPTTLLKLSAALAALDRQAPEHAAALVPVFVTIDPARDTVEMLKSYAAQFDPRWVMLTGPQAAIDALARAYGVFAARFLLDADGAYLMDHSGFVYLVGPDGRYQQHFENDVEVEALVAALLAPPNAATLNPLPGGQDGIRSTSR